MTLNHKPELTLRVQVLLDLDRVCRACDRRLSSCQPELVMITVTASWTAEILSAPSVPSGSDRRTTVTAARPDCSDRRNERG